MSYDPHKLLRFCKSLSTRASSTDAETIARTIISRAYYSAFLYAREYLRAKYNVRFTGTGEDHTIVESQLMKKVDRQLGSTIRTLRENRRAADYNLNNPAWCKLGRRSLSFDQKSQQDNILLAEFITNSLP
jgi:hypothetical protein